MSEEKGTRVYVGNLTDKIKKEHLEEEFTKFGKLNSVWVAFNPPGFAFIEFAKKEEAESACDSLNGQEVLGSKLRVEISKGRARNARGGGKFRGSGGPRQGGGGFRGRSGFGGGRDFGSRSGGGSGGGFRGGRGGRSGFGGSSGSRPSGGYGNRDGNRDSYGGGNRYGGSNSGGGGAGSRFRSRSPHGNRRF